MYTAGTLLQRRKHHSLAVFERVERVIELGNRRHLAVQLHHGSLLRRGLVLCLPVLDRLRACRLRSNDQLIRSQSHIKMMVVRLDLCDELIEFCTG